ncbi:MAG TPA: potassium channel family protein [Candidatus Saccharimonadales bacterium]|nr:potassium channel family protein [Candidatus Saccharimonadales bacterium]
MDSGEDIESLQKEHVALKKQVSAMAFVSVSVLCFGAIFFHIVEHWKWLDSFYFCTITLTTIGYGDFVPTTDAGKMFDMFYVLVGIGIIATFANLLIKGSLVRRQLKSAKKKAKRAKK